MVTARPVLARVECTGTSHTLNHIDTIYHGCESSSIEEIQASKCLLPCWLNGEEGLGKKGMTRWNLRNGAAVAAEPQTAP